MNRRLSLLASLVGAVAAGYTATVSASGFALIEQSVKGLGNAYAGAAAVAEDATTVYYNPAGMTRLKQVETDIGVHLIKTGVKFYDGGSTARNGAVLRGGDGDDGGVSATVPNFYYVRPMGGYSIGLGINAPFGLSTEYDETWQGRYQAVRSEISAINFNPAIATKFGDSFSVGAGLNIQHMQAELSSAIDFSAACQATPALAAFCTAVGLGTATLQSASTSGFGTNKAEGWGYGYNLGVLQEIGSSTRVGLAYRSRIKYKLEGDADFTVPGFIAAGGNAVYNALSAAFVDAGVTVRTTMPESYSLSAVQEMGSAWSLLADASRTRWSRIQELRIGYESSKSATVEALNWRDTWRYSLGLTYAHSPIWTWRTGIAYDQSPVPNPESRTARLPDNDRRWLSLGGSYKENKNLGVDFAYAHLRVSEGLINRTGALGDTLVGEFSNKVNIVSAQLNWLF